MSWIHDTVADFGRQLGISQLALGEGGRAQLRFSNGGVLAVEAVQRAGKDEVLVYVGRPAGHQAASLARTALAKAFSTLATPWPVQVGLCGSGPDSLLMALARLPERSFTTQALGQCVDHLHRWLDEVQAGQR